MTPLERTVHIVAIQQVIARFYDCLDGGRYEELVNLMAPDATWLRPIARAGAGRRHLPKRTAAFALPNPFS